MEHENCCRSFCDGCPWAEEQKRKLFGEDAKEKSSDENPKESPSPQEAS